MESVKIGAGSRCYSTKVCKHCHILWQRDINASKNMMTIAASVWAGHGRPSQFTPQNRRSEDGAVGSSNQAA
ncbi:hypothetical protein BDF20DRAFT_363565 [Mycotypha africana]|uniref:uncharacterized protein n=1 Tax=Mycotypha africana TaxID=64632 RepID=UPI0023014422|nr:uncharacterized protein BDF20DRAFT_363565 [Mycotypha africana]KAI8984068.1 hypothetical protein BDF20DRAFT_363565 [Mycotypha africana]